MKQFNKLQKLIIIIGASVIIVSCAFPPWINTFKSEGIYSENNAGYFLITNPPLPKIKDNKRCGIRIDIARLSVQIFLLVMSTSLGVFITNSKKE